MSGMVKLYFEEIEPVEADGDSALHMVDGPGAASPAREEGGAGVAAAAQTVRLASGGELADLRFDAFGEFASLNSTIRVPVECSALAPAGAGPEARGGAAMVCLGSSVLLFGGAARSGEHYNDMWQCTLPGAGRVRWERCDAPGAPYARSGHSLTLVPTSLSGPQQDQHGQEHPHKLGAVAVLFGGLNALEERAFNDVHVLSWSPEQAPRWLAFDCAGCAPQPRTAHSCSAVGSDLVVFGGSSPTCGALRDLHVLHVGLGRSGSGSGRPSLTWSTLRCSGPPPTMRELHGACVLGKLTAPTDLAFAHYGEGELEAGRAAATAPQVTLGEQADPTAALRHKEAGNSHFVRGEWDAARQCYDCALAVDPRGHVLYGNRSACLLKLGRAEEALADALSALRLSPRWGKGYLREALACAALGQRDATRTAYCAALECASSDSEREGFEKQRAALERQVASVIVEERQQQQQRQAQANEALDGASPPEPPDQLNGQGPWLVVFGGRSNESVLCDMRVLDLRSHTWLPETIETPFPRCGHSCSRLDGSRLLMFGGWDGGGNVFNTAAVYDLGSRMWTECEIKGDLEPRFSHAECAQAPAEAPQRVLVFGGVSVEKDHADVIVLSQAPA
jgi:hypothetical protein